ncbi:MAG: ABC transporter substrate-binding protein [Actinomycetales bacterium]|nr:ABC transporter substrate-binding protein [Actinomycetales bacterium]
MNHRHLRLLGATGAVAIAAVALAACASGDTPAPDPTSGESTAITVATYPVMSNAAVYIGQNEGIFADHGLDVTLQTITSGPDSIPLLLNGDLTFTSIDVPTAINAVKEDLGVVAVGAMMVGVDVDAGYVGVVTSPDSGITGWAGLEGKKVGVNALGSTPVALISASMKAVGADPSTVQWVQIAQPETIPALLAGQLDAANLAQPLLAAAEEQGFVQVGNPEQLTVPGVPTFIYVTTQAYADAHPEAVKAFQAALQEANAAANNDHALAIETAKSSTTVDPAVLDKVTGFPHWGDQPITAADLDKFIKFMIDAGQLDASTAPTGEDLLVKFN